jgi:hypothetical protein
MSEKLLPCPFCGSTDLEILPKDPSRDGNAWGAVQCVNVDCSTYDILKSHGVRVEDGQDVSDERGSDAYKSAAIAAWNRRTPAPEGEAVAWRVKDYADGWILFHHEAPARASSEARNGALVQPLYASPVVPVGVSREDEAWSLAMGIPAFNDLPAQFQQDIHAAILAALRPTDTGREP